MTPDRATGFAESATGIDPWKGYVAPQQGLAPAPVTWQAEHDVSIDPRTGKAWAHLATSTPGEIEAALTAAQGCARTVADTTPSERADWLRGVADAVLATADELAQLADEESGLGRERLDGEVVRCANQLRFHATVAEEGSWLDATIDTAANTATGTQPDLRRINQPLGPVAVFGASNFPFTFGTLGNDTAAALAAGCPVIVKGHPAHPRTHRRLMEVATQALAEAGAPAGALMSVTGFSSGTRLVLAPEVTAIAFTGSQRGGMALWSLAATREVVVPVFAEMGTVNPVVITPSAVDRLEALATGCVASYTQGMGQYCTKPGLVLAPAGSGFAAALADELLSKAPRGPMLTASIADGYVSGVDRLVASGGQVIATVPEPGIGFGVCATVVTADATQLVRGSGLLDECFGPTIVVVEYADIADLHDMLRRLPGALVASLMTGGGEDADAAGLVPRLAELVGRVVVDGWPTGVASAWAQHHGGPWPSTTVPAATSVGAAALRRFTRPVAYQDVPLEHLPTPLRRVNTWRIPRRMDGRVRVPRPS